MGKAIASYDEWWPVYHKGEQIGKIAYKTGNGYEYSYNGEYYASRKHAADSEADFDRAGWHDSKYQPWPKIYEPSGANFTAPDGNKLVGALFVDTQNNTYLPAIVYDAPEFLEELQNDSYDGDIWLDVDSPDSMEPTSIYDTPNQYMSLDSAIAWVEDSFANAR
jgi:hypothetical protein